MEKYIVFSTKISLPSINDFLIDMSIHFFDNKKQLNNYKKNFAIKNNISENSITIEYDIVPDEVFNKAVQIVESMKRFSKEKEIAIYMLIKNYFIPYEQKD